MVWQSRCCHMSYLDMYDVKGGDRVPVPKHQGDRQKCDMHMYIMNGVTGYMIPCVSGLTKYNMTHHARVIWLTIQMGWQSIYYHMSETWYIKVWSIYDRLPVQMSQEWAWEIMWICLVWPLGYLVYYARDLTKYEYVYYGCQNRVTCNLTNYDNM